MNVTIAKVTSTEFRGTEITYQEVEIAGCDSHYFSHFSKGFLYSIGGLQTIAFTYNPQFSPFLSLYLEILAKNQLLGHLWGSGLQGIVNHIVGQRNMGKAMERESEQAVLVRARAPASCLLFSLFIGVNTIQVCPALQGDWRSVCFAVKG